MTTRKIFNANSNMERHRVAGPGKWSGNVSIFGCISQLAVYTSRNKNLAPGRTMATQNDASSRLSIDL